MLPHRDFYWIQGCRLAGSKFKRSIRMKLRVRQAHTLPGRSAKTLPLIKFPFRMWAILVNVVQENLRCQLSAECIAPVRTLNAPIDSGVSGLHFHRDCALRAFKPDGPGRRGNAAQVRGHAYLTRAAVTVACQHVPGFVNSKIGIGWKKV